MCTRQHRALPAGRRSASWGRGAPTSAPRSNAQRGGSPHAALSWKQAHSQFSGNTPRPQHNRCSRCTRLRPEYCQRGRPPDRDLEWPVAASGSRPSPSPQSPPAPPRQQDRPRQVRLPEHRHGDLPDRHAQWPRRRVPARNGCLLPRSRAAVRRQRPAELLPLRALLRLSRRRGKLDRWAHRYVPAFHRRRLPPRPAHKPRGRLRGRRRTEADLANAATATRPLRGALVRRSSAARPARTATATPMARISLATGAARRRRSRGLERALAAPTPAGAAGAAPA